MPQGEVHRGQGGKKLLDSLHDHDSEAAFTDWTTLYTSYVLLQQAVKKLDRQHAGVAGALQS